MSECTYAVDMHIPQCPYVPVWVHMPLNTFKKVFFSGGLEQDKIEVYFGFEPPYQYGDQHNHFGPFFFSHCLGPLGAWRRPRRWLDAGSHAAPRFQKWHSRAVKMHHTPDIGLTKSKKKPTHSRPFAEAPKGHF